MSKLANNVTFAKMAIKSKTAAVLVLDNETLNTSKILREKGFSGTIIVVENNIEVFKKQRENNTYGVKHAFSNLNRFLIAPRTNVAYFDYFGSIRGNKKVKPLEDILKFIKRASICDIYLALTVAKRVEIKYTDGDLGEEILDLYLKPCFAYGRREIIEHTMKSYRGTAKGMTMMFYTFQLRFNPDVPELEFLVEKGRFVGYSTASR